VLAARLARLVAEGVLARERYQERPLREHYRATEMGAELYPVLLALMDWGDRWCAGEAGPAALVHHHDCGRERGGRC
jgi:DNA-binding HxlR family transcriptional regulator